MFFSAVSKREAILWLKVPLRFMQIMRYLTVVPIWLVCSCWLVSLLPVLRFVTTVIYAVYVFGWVRNAIVCGNQYPEMGC